MKKIFTLIAALLIALGASAGTVTRNFNDLGSFDAINISSAFKATLIQSDRYAATVTIDTEYEQYMDVSVIGTVLYVRMKDLPVKLTNLKRKKMEVTICVPSLKRIYLSGAASLRSDDVWSCATERFVLSLSGAAKAEKLRITAVELGAEASGASVFSVVGDFATMEIALSGAAAATFSGNWNDISLDASGSSKGTFIGEAEQITATCSGASRLDGSLFKVDSAKLICTGASKSTIDVSELLDVELTGASTCYYRSDNASVRVVPSISRASSLKKKN